jgi:hypothetical protein
MVLSEPIPDDLQERFRASWAGCLGGMVPEGDYLDLVRRAGFSEIQVVARHHLRGRRIGSHVPLSGAGVLPGHP